MKILYLYAELMGYQIPVFKEYVDGYNAEVHVVHWNNKKLTPYIPPELNGVTYYNRSEQNVNTIIQLANELKPDIVYVSGWMDKDYLSVCRVLKKKGVPIVAGCDTQWRGDLKQLVGTVYFKLFLKSCFTHIWVAGVYQYEYARKLGFQKDKIIFNTLSANTNLFNDKYIKSENVNKTFLYVGNFREVKGTDILIEAFEIYRDKLKGDWSLICIGNGDLSYLLKDKENIIVYDFKSQEELIELSKMASIFILPSRFDQWGLVVHEFASLGFPLLLSNTVGAASTFLINGFNGHYFKSGSKEMLAKVMCKMANMNHDELIKMGKNSQLLGARISPRITAASFMSILSP